MKLREPGPITDYTSGGDCPRVTLDGPEAHTQASYLGSAIFNRATPANPAELTEVEQLSRRVEILELAMQQLLEDRKQGYR